MVNIFKKLWKKCVHWYHYRDKPIVRFNVAAELATNSYFTRNSYAALFSKSKEEHGAETACLDVICKHYKCDFRVETADVCVLVFNDKRLYTMFMLKYSECL